MYKEVKPNVLFIMTDQLNSSCIGYKGDPIIKTKNIDRLAREGVSFESAYTVSPVCMSARCSLLSGLYPHNHHYWNNFADDFLAEDLATMFQDVKKAGYYTAHIGKSHFFDPGIGNDFRDYNSYFKNIGIDDMYEVGSMYGALFHKSCYNDYLKEKNLFELFSKELCEKYARGEYYPVPTELPFEDYLDSYIGEKTIDIIKKRPQGKPFFIRSSFPGPHCPVDPPAEYAQMYSPDDMEIINCEKETVEHGKGFNKAKYTINKLKKIKALYYGRISLIDYWIGKILDALDKENILQNTMIIFTTDHGEHMGSHERLGKNTFYEESVKIPIIIWWPGHIKAGLTTNDLVELIDIYPTVIEAINGEMTQGRFGKSLLNTAKGNPEKMHDAVFSEIGGNVLQQIMVRSDRYKWWLNEWEEKLFDLEYDPFERHNLVDDPAYFNVIKEMRIRLADFYISTQYNKAANYKSRFSRLAAMIENTNNTDNLKNELYEIFRKIQN